MQRAPEREPAAGAQDAVSLPVTQLGVDPMPGRRGEHQVERVGRALPRLERLDVDLDGQSFEVVPRALRELCPQLDAHDGETPREQRTRRFAGRAADLEQTRARLEAGQVNEVVEEPFRVIGTGGVVQIRGRVERLAQRLAHLLAREPGRGLGHRRRK